MKVCTFIFFSFIHDMIKAVIVVKKILIVEDDQSIASSLKEMLEKKGYFIEIAESKKETLKKVNEYVDLILLDIQLPDGNGIDLCKEIKEKYQGSTNILFVGRVVQNKCQDDLIKCFSLYAKYFNADSHLFLAGDLGMEGYVSQLKELCREREVEDKVLFLGKERIKDIL